MHALLSCLMAVVYCVLQNATYGGEVWDLKHTDLYPLSGVITPSEKRYRDIRIFHHIVGIIAF